MIDANLLRRSLLEASARCGAPVHLGGSLGCVDILNVLYGRVIRHNPRNPGDPGRDFFVMSKGHSFLALLSVLFHHGYFSQEDFNSFQTDGGVFIAHPVRDIGRGIESSTGSLGQGLSVGLGLAIGSSKAGGDNRVFVLMGDSECSEGSVWEAAMLAGQRGVGNLIAIIDSNGLGNDGYGPIHSASALEAQFMALGWDVQVVDGHDNLEVERALMGAVAEYSSPSLLVAKTVKGKGISFMEGNNDWHHAQVTQKTLELALQELS